VRAQQNVVKIKDFRSLALIEGAIFLGATSATDSVVPTVVPTVVPAVVPSVTPSVSASPAVSAPAGVALLSAAERANAKFVAVKVPLSRSAANAPEVSVSIGAAVAPVVSGLPANTPLNASMSVPSQTRAKASFVPIGKTRSTAAGRARVPAFKASRTGVYTIRLSTPAGKAYYLKVKVTAKKSTKS